MMRSLIVILTITGLLACDPEVDMQVVSPDRLLSVSAFISPQDTVFNVYVYRGMPAGSIIAADSAAVKDAFVTISDGASSDTLRLTYSQHPSTGVRSYRYSGRVKNVVLRARTTCSLYVRSGRGEIVTADCTIPSGPGQPEITGHAAGDDFNFSVTWTERQSHQYFTLDLETEGSYEMTSQDRTYRVWLHARLTELTPFPSDEQLPLNEYEGVVKDAYRAEDPLLRVYVRNVDENIYKYFSTYRQYEDWNSNNTGTLLPNFKSMPLVHSNIRGGVGVFGGYNQSTAEVRF